MVLHLVSNCPKTGGTRLPGRKSPPRQSNAFYIALVLIVAVARHESIHLFSLLDSKPALAFRSLYISPCEPLCSLGTAVSLSACL